MEEFFLYSDPGIPLFVLCISFFLTGAIVLVEICRKRTCKKARHITWSILIEYLFLVISSTLVFRPTLESASTELMPLWTYNAVLNHTVGVSIWDIVLNVILFFPIGLFVSLLYPQSSSWKIVLIGIVFSSLIEFLQFYYSKGTAQFDDVLHNAIGCYLGAYAAVLLRKRSFFNGTDFE